MSDEIYGRRIAFAIEKNKRAIADFHRAAQSRKLEIQQDEYLENGERKKRLDRHAEEARRRQQELHWKRLDLERQRIQHAKQVRMRLTPDVSKQAQFTRLRERGIAQNLILAQARENHDDEMVEAILQDALYHGGKDGFVSADNPLVDACHRALAEIGSGEGQREMHQAVVDSAAKSEHAEAHDTYAAKVALGDETPHDRLVLAFAIGPEDGEDD